MPEKVIICNATLVWRNPVYTPRERYFLFHGRDGSDSFRNAIDCEDCGLTQIAWLLAEEISVGCKEVAFKPERDSYIAYVDGFFGRRAIPAEAWAFKALRPNQKAELLKRLACYRPVPEAIRSLFREAGR